MEHYVGLDVSLKLTAICIVDRTEKIEREGVVSSDPEGLRNSSDRMPACCSDRARDWTNGDMAMD
jgi:hypothetical protein